MFKSLMCKVDMHLRDVYYITDFYNNKFARISKSCEGWYVWYYTEKYGKLRDSMKDVLNEIEHVYMKKSREILSRFATEGDGLF